MTATPAPTARTRKGALKACKCRDFEAHVMTDGGNPDDIEIVGTGCKAETNRLFAQGHDAKLVSFLVKWELDGLNIAYGRATGVLTHTDAVGAAGTVSEALAVKAQNALNKATEKEIARKARQDTKARKAAEVKPPRQVAARVVSKPEQVASEIKNRQVDELVEAMTAPLADAPIVAATEEAPQIRQAKIKVGRWTYDAEIDSTDQARYTTKQGEVKILPAGGYSIVGPWEV